MQVSEFKAWFEGFTEDMTKLPTVKQWSRIKARIEEIDGVATTELYFRDYYWRPYQPYWPQKIWTSTTNAPNSSAPMAEQLTGDPGSSGLNANQAFTALGKAEAVSVTA